MASANEMIITFGEGKRVNAEFKGHSILTDQRKDNGGDDSAPEPFVLFLASIGTCAGIYVLSFCRARNLPTEGIELVQTHEYDEQKKRMGKIRIEIRVPPTFPEKYHETLVRTASQCAVKKTIMDPPEFEIATVVVG